MQRQRRRCPSFHHLLSRPNPAPVLEGNVQGSQLFVVTKTDLAFEFCLQSQTIEDSTLLVEELCGF
jgi:hypothetical protein